MSLIKRITKGIPLTHQELDNNLQYLDDKINNIPTPPTIDETTLVHKSGDEEIGGAKLLTGDFKVATSDPADSTKSANIVSRSKVTTPISYLEASMTYAGVNEYSYLNVKPKGAYMGSNTGYIGTYNKVAQIIDNEVDLISDKIVIQGKAGNINKYEGFLKVVNDGAGKYVLQSVSSIGGVVTKTYAEIQAMITAKTLVVGTDYKITGVDTALYGGTDIILKANTTNELAEKGVGFFYNPRYTRNSKGIGQGMWNDKVIVYLGNANNSPTGTFLDGDLVTANNGATGNLVLGIVRWGYNYITPVSGDWSTSTSFTNGTGASSQTYPSSDVIIPGYAVNATTIWGGKLWKNLTGAIGTVLNEYALDATNWVAVAYNETDYDLVIDDIWYSIATDKIIGRYEVIGNNKVIFQANYESAANTNSPIKQFQWGNPYSRTYFNGLANNEIVNSILSCINDKGSTIRNNKLNTAKINTNTFFNNSKIEGNILTAGAYIQACTLNSSSMSNNQILNGCNWSNLKFSGGSMDNNFMIGGYVSGYYQPVLSGTSVNGNFFNNYLFSPGINGVPLIPSTGFTNHVKSVRGTDIDDLASRGDVNILSRIAVNDANYVLTQTDDLISFTTLTQTRSVSLPAPGFWALPYFPNRTFTIKDESGTATTNPITIIGTIDGVVNPTIINVNFGKYSFYYNGTSWYSRDTKISASSAGNAPISKTYAEMQTLVSTSALTPGSTYKITDRGDRGIYLIALTNNELTKQGTRKMLCPKTYTEGGSADGNSWQGVWTTYITPSVNDLFIFGGKVWKNLTGVKGTKSGNTLDATNWLLIPKSSFSNSEYVELQFDIYYDFANDWIEKQMDHSGNIVGQDFKMKTAYGLQDNPCDVTDWNLATKGPNDRFNNNIVPFGIYNNRTGGITDNKCNRIANNPMYAGAAISNNILNGNIEGNHVSGITNNICVGSIENNVTMGEISYNRSPNISNNTSMGNINYNTCEVYGNLPNVSVIEYNNGRGIYSNNVMGRIAYNNVNGYIQYTVSSVAVDIINNNNNGTIGGSYSTPTNYTANVTDVQVNK